jgi:hypothetical protein
MSRWSMKVLASVVTTAALAPKASAFIPEGSVDRVGALYKVSKALLHHETLRLVLVLVLVLLLTVNIVFHSISYVACTVTKLSHM